LVLRQGGGANSRLGDSGRGKPGERSKRRTDAEGTPKKKGGVKTSQREKNKTKQRRRGNRGEKRNGAESGWNEYRGTLQKRKPSSNTRKEGKAEHISRKPIAGRKALGEGKRGIGEKGCQKVKTKKGMVVESGEKPS